MRLKRLLTAFGLMFYIIMSCSIFIYAGTYSYNDVNLDYSITRGLYGAGRNGYKLVLGVWDNGNTFRYRKARVEYVDYMGHDVFSPYGKTYRAKATAVTSYLVPIPWSEQSQIQVYNYYYGDPAFKSLKILNPTSRSMLSSSNQLYYIKIKKGKIIRMISPLIYAL